MILKKPYAFLIKYFRIIHIILALPIIYLIIKTGSIVNFFSDYVSSNYYTSISNIAGTYINYFMYLSVLIILFAGIAIYFLMRKKEKSTKFYFLLIIFYIILFIMLGITHGILSNMEMNSLEATTARAYRDFSYIFYLPQFIFAAFTIFRGIGFDLKKFNFDMDIKELEITDIDSEEFELNFGFEDYKLKRNIRRFIREFKYYVKENKFIFGILCSVIIIIFATLMYLNFEVYNKTYKQKETLFHNNLNLKVTGSMVTNRDLGGNLLKDNKYYVVIQLFIENKTKQTLRLDYNNFFLEFENRRSYPVLDKAEYFIDFGLPIKKETDLLSGSANTYLLAFEIQESEIMNKYTLKILEQVTLEVGQISPDYKTISLSPENAYEIKNVEEYKLGKIATFEESHIGYTSFQITNYQFLDTVTYQYKKCYENQTCRNLTDKVSASSVNNTLLVLDTNYRLDESTLYFKGAKTNKLFANHFLSVNYQNMETSKTIKGTNKTPSTYNKGIILEVPSELKTSSKINIYATIRNMRYILNLK